MHNSDFFADWLQASRYRSCPTTILFDATYLLSEKSYRIITVVQQHTIEHLMADSAQYRQEVRRTNAPTLHTPRHLKSADPTPPGGGAAAPSGVVAKRGAAVAEKDTSRAFPPQVRRPTRCWRAKARLRRRA